MKNIEASQKDQEQHAEKYVHVYNHARLKNYVDWIHILLHLPSNMR